MRIVILGATGYIGKGLVAEALARGHQVTAVARNVANISSQQPSRAVSVDVLDKAKLADVFKDQDVVISAFSGFGSSLPAAEAKALHSKGVKTIIEASKSAEVKRLLFVGGAGSLKVPSGKDLLDTPEFPAEWLENAKSTRDTLALLKAENSLAWSFLSPSALIQPGQRTGKFRLGKDELLVDASGNSSISVEDYAVAMLDEAEQPKHVRERFTVGY